MRTFHPDYLIYHRSELRHLAMIATHFSIREVGKEVTFRTSALETIKPLCNFYSINGRDIIWTKKELSSRLDVSVLPPSPCP